MNERHARGDAEPEIYHGGTLMNEFDVLREMNPSKMHKFDAFMANPSFHYRWDSDEAMCSMCCTDTQ